MYRQPSKRRQLTQRILVYIAMSIAVIALVVVLLFIMQGYRLNQQDGRLEQGGLMQFDSKPTGADVAIDGVTLGTRTTNKATASAGQHFVAMNKTGYRTWQKSVVMEPGAVLWLNYARLIPNDLPVENMLGLTSVSSSVASPSSRWMAIKEQASDPALRLIDLSRNPIENTVVTFPADSFTPPAEGKGHDFLLEAWDPTSRYVLVKHTYNDGAIEWLVVDTENVAATKNITKLLGVTINKVLFSNANSNILFVQTDSDVRKVDIAAATLSGPLISNVAEFALHDRSMIVYSTKRDENKERSIGYYEDGAEKPHPVQRFNDESDIPLHFVLDKYFGEYYLAVAHGETTKVLTGRLPTDEAGTSQLTEVASFQQPGGTGYLSMRANGRLIVAQNEKDLRVYDLELKKMYQTMLKGDGLMTKQVGWVDNYMPWSALDGTLRLYEFDGTNQNDIMPVVPGQSVSLDPNDTYLYGISGNAQAGFHLSRVRLILP